jgi:hypothetical protein
MCIVHACDRPSVALDYCRTHYVRTRRGTPLDAPIRPVADWRNLTPAQRVMQRVVADGDCLIWQGQVNRSGYGKITVGGRYTTTHRVMCEDAHGPGPGLAARHSCDRPACVNPAHLSWGSIAENNADMASRGRGRSPRGSAQPTSKVTEDDVRAIRADSRPYAVIAEQYGISKAAISLMRSRKTWAHVSDSA